MSLLIEPPQRQNNPVAINNSSNHKYNKEIPSETTEVQPKKEDPNHNNANQNKGNKIIWANFIVQTILAFATIGAFVAAFYYACIAKQTLNEIKQQTESVKIGALAAKSAADTASDTLILADQSFKSTQKQFRLDQRAWINIEGAIVKGPLEPSKIIKFEITTKNSGKTPALHVKYIYKVWIEHLGQRLLERKKSAGIDVAYGSGNQKTQTLYSYKPYTPQLIKLLQSGEVKLFIEIEFTYFDIYNRNILRHTCECFYYNPIISPAMSFCETGCSRMD